MLIYLCALVFFLPLGFFGMQVKFGDPVTLDCIEDKEPVIYFFWKYKNTTGNVAAKEIFPSLNNEIFPPFKNVIYPAGVRENGNYSITLRPITFAHEGQYLCIIKINGSSAEQKSKFNVKVDGWTKVDSVSPGGTVNVPLHSNESVPLHFWKNGTKYDIGRIDIKAQKYELEERYKDRYEMRDGVLGIHRVTPGDAGIYTVQDEHSGKNISSVIVDITSLKDSRTNFHSENSTNVKDDQQQGCSHRGVIPSVIAAVVIVSILICLAKYHLGSHSS